MSVDKKLVNLDEAIAKKEIERNLLLEKAFKSNDVDSIYKAQRYMEFQKKNNIKYDDKGKAMLIDPFNSSGMGYYEKKANVSFDILRAMAKTPIIAAIIASRREQVADYCIPQQDKYSKGFIIQKRSKGIEVDDDKELTDQEKEQVDNITEFILSCGSKDDEWYADDFEGFTRKVIEDSLVLDQAVFEVPQTRVRLPDSFYALDAATIRLADNYDVHNGNSQLTSGKEDGYYPAFVQIYQGTIVAEWYPWELGFGIRNPKTNIYGNGYGRSELEELVQTVTALLNSDSYNANFFRNGTAPKGALLVKKAAGLNPDTVAEFKREWGAQMGGVQNFHKTPVFDAEHIEWMDLHKSNRDMEFSKYQEYLVKLACAIYKISPEEIGFSIQGSQQGGGMGNGRSGAKQDRDYSIDKGLKPLLKSYEGWLNKWVLSPLTKNQYEFKFVGMDAETSKEEEERLQKAVSSYMTVNEIREQKGLDALEGDEYNMVLNPVVMQKMQADSMAAMGGMGGDPAGGYDGEVDGGSGGYDSPFEADTEDNPMWKSLLNDFDKLVEDGN
jgi:hypothetical protein